MKLHKETFLELHELGKRIPPYQPTFSFSGPLIDDYHRFLSTCPLKDGVLIEIANKSVPGAVIPGWLRREDALKLYELAYFSQVGILELGCAYGLSTCVIAAANLNSPWRKQVTSVDLVSACVQTTEKHLRDNGVFDSVTLLVNDALSAIRRFAVEEKFFDFVFIDHAHDYEHVYPVCRELKGVLVKGAYCLFHDFNDRRNGVVEESAYGVYQAVVEGLSVEDFDFCGIYGCAALYQFR